MSVVVVIHRDSAVRDGLAFAMKAHGCDVHTFIRASEVVASPLLAPARCLIIGDQVVRREGFGVVRAYEAANAAGKVILLSRDLSAYVLRRDIQSLPETDDGEPSLPVEDVIDEILAACPDRLLAPAVPDRPGA